MERRRLLERLRLLCSTGAGLEALAAPVSAIARDLVGAESGSIFWHDTNGQPGGFYHDSAPAEIKDLFVTRFDDLFSAPGEFNMVHMTNSNGPAIGTMSSKTGVKSFLESNVSKYLCQPLGHFHGLDVRIEQGGRGVALLCLWNPAGRPFTRRDEAAMEPVRTQLGLATKGRLGALRWQSNSARTAHMIADPTGRPLHSIDRACEEILREAHLLGQAIPMAGALRDAPLFCQQLAQMLKTARYAELYIPAANGRLHLSATINELLTGGRPCQYLFVSVDCQIAPELRAVERVCDLPLTYLQKQLALFAMQGGRRADCVDRFGVSPEALKKHLGAVFDSTAASSWSDLREVFLND